MVRIRRTGVDQARLDALVSRAKAWQRYAQTFVAFPENDFWSGLVRDVMSRRTRVSPEGHMVSTAPGEITAHAAPYDDAPTPPPLEVEEIRPVEPPDVEFRPPSVPEAPPEIERDEYALPPHLWIEAIDYVVVTEDVYFVIPPPNEAEVTDTLEIWTNTNEFYIEINEYLEIWTNPNQFYVEAEETLTVTVNVRAIPGILINDYIKVTDTQEFFWPIVFVNVTDYIQMHDTRYVRPVLKAEPSSDYIIVNPNITAELHLVREASVEDTIWVDGVADDANVPGDIDVDDYLTVDTETTMLIPELYLSVDDSIEVTDTIAVALPVLQAGTVEDTINTTDAAYINPLITHITVSDYLFAQKPFAVLFYTMEETEAAAKALVTLEVPGAEETLTVKGELEDVGLGDLIPPHLEPATQEDIVRVNPATPTTAIAPYTYAVTDYIEAQIWDFDVGLDPPVFPHLEPALPLEERLRVTEQDNDASLWSPAADDINIGADPGEDGEITEELTVKTWNIGVGLGSVPPPDALEAGAAPGEDDEITEELTARIWAIDVGLDDVPPPGTLEIGAEPGDEGEITEELTARIWNIDVGLDAPVVPESWLWDFEDNTSQGWYLGNVDDGYASVSGGVVNMYGTVPSVPNAFGNGNVFIVIEVDVKENTEYDLSWRAGNSNKYNVLVAVDPDIYVDVVRCVPLCYFGPTHEDGLGFDFITDGNGVDWFGFNNGVTNGYPTSSPDFRDYNAFDSTAVSTNPPHTYPTRTYTTGAGETKLFIAIGAYTVTSGGVTATFQIEWIALDEVP